MYSEMGIKLFSRMRNVRKDRAAPPAAETDRSKYHAWENFDCGQKWFSSIEQRKRIKTVQYRIYAIGYGSSRAED